MTSEYLVPLLILSVVVAGMVPVVAAEEQVIGQPRLEIFSPDNEFSAGQETELEIFISNDGRLKQAGPEEWVDRVTTARATTLTFEDDDVPIDIQTDRYPVGSVGEGTHGPFTFTMTVPEGTPPGTYRIPVRVKYTYTNIVTYGGDEPEFSDSSYNRKQFLTIEVKREARFEIDASSTDALIGEQSDLELTLTNTGTEPARDARVTITSQSDEVTFGTGSRNSETFVGAWGPGETRTVEYTVAFSDDATLREYTLDASINYEDTDGIQRQSRTLTTSLRPAGEQTFVLEATDSSVVIGARGRLTVVVTNAGPRTVYDSSVVVTSQGDELRFGTGSRSSEAFVGAWRPGETRTVEYKVTLSDEATIRNYTLKTVVQYDDVDDNTYEYDELTANLRPIGEETFELRDVESSLRVGDEGTVTGTVVNTGPTTVRNPVVVLTINNPTITLNSPEYAIPDLAPGERAEFSFDVEVSDSADAGSRQFGVTLRYDDTEDDRRTSDPLQMRVPIREQRDVFAVEVVEDSGTIAAGSSSSVRLRVANAGEQTVRDVSAKVFVNDPLSSDDDEAIIPELEPGESAEIVIGLSVGGSALDKAYPLSVDFQYDEPDGDTVLSRTYRVPISVTRGPQRSLPFGLGLPVAVLVVAGGIAGVWFWRRSNRV